MNKYAKQIGCLIVFVTLVVSGFAIGMYLDSIVFNWFPWSGN